MSECVQAPDAESGGTFARHWVTKMAGARLWGEWPWSLGGWCISFQWLDAGTARGGEQQVLNVLCLSLPLSF